ncbi:hypothetical protein LTR62_001460 [Meristemomyces frigidus]|uniref:MFS general substrate transporter n=1 Tax=Meristemomyces frigidus TaxID=1508187 RepID=A0AAN7TNC6_9PEZI|nr:hypothetical protein LTR62_001460 [Meristemomyces frigidus]
MATLQSSRKNSETTTITDPDETTALLERKKSTASVLWSKSAVYRVLFTGFLVSLSFGVTQVPLVYVFGVMTCDEYYKHHASPPPGLGFDRRCQVPEIQASTAMAVALLGSSTTFFGVINLFFTGWTMKVFGIKKSLLLTVALPAVRLGVQTIGVGTGAELGITIIQLSQIITVVGGPVGYLLALNSLATEVVESSERTATLGRLQGCSMFGTALGFLAGGLIGDAYGQIWPFRVAVFMFILCCIYVQFFLPTIRSKEVESKAAKTLSSFFDPIKMFAPQKYLLANGNVRREWGILLLGIGTFLGVLATSYIPVLLQMYSTDVFDFGTSENGVLISINSTIRGLFLTLAFPVIISSGRKWLDKRDGAAMDDTSAVHNEDIPPIPTEPAQVAAADRSMEESVEPVQALKPSPPSASDGTEVAQSFHFDLIFTKYSLVLDGILTGLATFTTKGWQMYLVAVILPLASGTGSAAKGTILQMCTAEQRTDALSAISLVELVARLSSTSLFGLVLSGFAAIGRPNLTFTCNAAIAVLGFGILMFARFPPRGSERWVEAREEEAECEGT